MLTQPHFVSELVPLIPRSRRLQWWHTLLAVLLCMAFGAFIVSSIHWPWVNDTGIMHYVVFLIHHGMSPYRDIIDINWPGSYLSEAFGMALFGPSNLAWRLYDYLLLVAMVLSAIAICRKYHWIGGLFAGVLFALVHGADGGMQACVRDEVITVLLLMAWALIFTAVRASRAIYSLIGGVALGWAAMIKPTAFAFELLLILFIVLSTRNQGRHRTTYSVSLLFGSATVFASVGLFLWRNDSLGAFLFRLRTITAYYISLNHPALISLLSHSLPSRLIFLLPFPLVLFIYNKSWRNLEILSIVSAVVCGMGFYLIQQKGYVYQRYPYTAFLLLWTGVEAGVAVRSAGIPRVLAESCLAVGTLVVAPFYLHRIIHVTQPDSIAQSMIRDLAGYPTEELQGNVQCLDGVMGCYATLYRMSLVQSTGLMGDQLLFTKDHSPVVDSFRTELLKKWEATPPKIFILTNYWYGERQSFQKLQSWPQLSAFISSGYALEVERTLPASTEVPNPIGYRIYKRK